MRSGMGMLILSLAYKFWLKVHPASRADGAMLDLRAYNSSFYKSFPTLSMLASLVFIATTGKTESFEIPFWIV
jgi:hypothetical protein